MPVSCLSTVHLWLCLLCGPSLSIWIHYIPAYLYALQAKQTCLPQLFCACKLQPLETSQWPSSGLSPICWCLSCCTQNWTPVFQILQLCEYGFKQLKEIIMSLNLGPHSWSVCSKQQRRIQPEFTSPCWHTDCCPAGSLWHGTGWIVPGEADAGKTAY